MEAAEHLYKTQILALEEELGQQKALNAELEKRYRKEKHLMLSAWQAVGIQKMGAQLHQNAMNQTRSAPAR